MSPLHTPRGWDDLIENASMSPGVHMDLDENLVLLPDNLAENQYFSEIDEFGDADGYPFETIPKADGYLIAATKAGGAEDSATFQNLSALPVERPGYLQAQPVIQGRRPVRDPSAAAPLPRPAYAPKVVLESAGGAGLSGTTATTPRLYCYTLVTPDGLHTDATDAVAFHNANGQNVRFKMPEGVPEGMRVGIYVSEPGKKVCLEQRVWDPRNGDYTLTTYRFGRAAPTRNETYLGKPSPYRFGHGVRRDRYEHGDLAAAEWRFTATQTTDYGESLPAITPTSRITEGAENRAWWIHKPPRKPGARGCKLYVQIRLAGETVGTWYLVVPARRVDGPSGYWPYSGRRSRVPVTGQSLFEQVVPEGGAPILEEQERFLLVSQNPPTEDTSGIEGPTGVPEVPIAVSPSYPPPGIYRYAYAKTMVDDVGLLSPFTVVSVGAGQIARVIPSNSVGLIANAEGVEVSASGIPYGMTVSQTGGSYRSTDGVHTIFTAGAQTGATPTMEFERVQVSPEKPLTAVGRIRVVAQAGEAVLSLRQYRQDGTFTTTELARINGTDYRDVQRLFGSSGTALDSLTVSVSLFVNMAGATKNMTVDAYGCQLFPFPFAPPRVEKSKEESREPANYDPPPKVAFPVDSEFAVGSPPGPVIVDPEPAVDEVTFDDGVLPASFTHVRQVQNQSSISEVIPLAAIDGSYGWHVKDETTIASNAIYLQKTYSSVSGDGLALRVKYRILSLPSPVSAAEGTYVNLLAIDTATNQLLGVVRLYSNGALLLASVDRFRRVRYANFQSVLRNGDSFDLELITSGGGTANGMLNVVLGVNGGQRSVQSQISAVDWSGLQPRTVRFGAVGESAQVSKWDFHIDSAKVTRRGDVIESTLPPSTQVFVPDTPTRADGTPILFGTGGERINRMSLFVHPDQPKTPLGLQDVLIAYVKPEQTYSASIPGRHAMFEGAEPWFPWTFFVRAPDGRTKDVGCLYGASGCSGVSGWGERSLSFVVPEGFTELRCSFRGFPGGGLFLWHGPLKLSEGSVPKEGAGRFQSASVTALIDTRTPLGDVRHLPLKDGWRSFGVVRADILEGTSVSARYRSTNDPGGLMFVGPWQTDESLVVPADLLQTEATLSGDGVLTPVVPVRGLYVETSPFDSQLVRADRSELPGGTLTKGLESYFSRPEYQTSKVGGRSRSFPITERIRRLPAFTIQVFTELAKDELNNTFLDLEWVIEAPGYGGTGVILRIKPDGVLDIKESAGWFVEDKNRYVYGIGAVTGAEVLEVSSLA